jgi:hypothetical protein
MKKIFTLFLCFSLALCFGQINDDIRGGASQKKSSSGGGGSSGGSGGGVSGGGTYGDISLLIDACGCLYNVGVPFFTEVVVKGIKKNTAYIQEHHDTLPRLRNLELNLGYGAFPDKENVYLPRLRMQAGYLGTSFRTMVIQDNKNPFLKDLLAIYDWQMLEFNFLTNKHFTIRAGGGFLYFPNKLDPSSSILSPELATSADFFFARDRARASIEGRLTPFGESKTRKEASTRLYVRPWDKNLFRPEIFVGAYYANFFDSADLYKLEAGLGFMLY